MSILDEVPFDIPDSWEWCRLSNCTHHIGSKENQILSKEVKPEGRIPVVSQSQNLIDGYCNNDEKVINVLPLVMFGDHTRNVKYIDFPFVIGADGTKFHKVIGLNSKYIFYWMTYAAINLKNRGYARHYSLLATMCIPIPPLSEQERIVNKVEELIPLIDQYGEAEEERNSLDNSLSEHLKKSILQLAVQGKLVPQDPNDEPASVLLERIRAEKERLIKEGKIKRDKNESVIFRRDNSHYEKRGNTEVCIDNEIPFEIPETWGWMRWGSLSESIQYGYNTPAHDTGRIKMVRISDIQNGQVMWDTVPYCDIPESDIESYLLKKNDILFARTGGTVGKSYLVQDVPEEAIYAGYLIRTRYSTSLCSQYLKYFMESPLYWEQLKEGTTATAQPNCNGKTLGRMLVPIPPVVEQQRIVDTLNKAFERANAL